MKFPVLLLLLPLHLTLAADPARKADPFAGLLLAPDQLAKGRAELGLTADQIARLRAGYEASVPAYREKAAAVAAAQRALHDVLEKPVLDEKAATERFADLVRAEGAMKEVEFRAMVGARAVLTPEQFQKARALRGAPSAGAPPAGASHGLDKATERRVHTALREAMRGRDVAAVERAVAEGVVAAGASLAEPEEPVKPERPPADARELTHSTLRGAYATMLAEIDRVKFWKIGLDPAQLGQFPRTVGSVVIGTLAARRAGCAEPERLLATAREAGDFLVWTQEQGGRGVFPMPARRNGEGKVWGIVERALRNAEQQGRYEAIVHNGWCVEDAGIGDDGGLQIENAVCGIGVLDLYEATRDEKYLRSAKAAGDWAIGRECVPNWNYNSFSVWLLAELHRVTGDDRYLASAKEKARLGVLPGQLKDGPREGRWLDPHNARPNYHYILTRSLACLVPRLATDDPEREPIVRSLRRALLAWNPTFPRDGAPNISSASEALALLEMRLPDHAQLLGETGVRPALTTLELLGTSALAAGRRASDPSAWGLLLEAAAQRGLPKSAAASRHLGEEKPLPFVAAAGEFTAARRASR